MEPNDHARQPHTPAEFFLDTILVGGVRFRPVSAPFGPPDASLMSGRLLRYRILIEPGLESELGAFAPHVDRTLTDPNGWAASGLRFARVDHHADFTVLLAKPKTVNRLCRPLKTGGVYSCGLRGRAVLNAVRWRRGVRHFKGDLATYRTYLVNHEVGHLLGQPHRRCPPKGGPAPLMMQQTKHLDRCKPNGIPLSREIKSLQNQTPAWAQR
jgi:hypothetical protein